MSNFAPGDEVVCVDDADSGGLLVRGCHYVIRDLNAGGPEQLYIRLVGIEQVARDIGWYPRRFRPVKRESIELFRAMCASNKPLVEV